MKNKFRAIVFDDNELICNLLEIILNKFGFKVDSFTDIDEAVDAIKSNDYFISFVDWDMMDEKAIEFIEKINNLKEERQPKIFAMMTSLITGEILFAKQSGVVDCVAKPFNQKIIGQLLHDNLS